MHILYTKTYTIYTYAYQFFVISYVILRRSRVQQISEDVMKYYTYVKRMPHTLYLKIANSSRILIVVKQDNLRNHDEHSLKIIMYIAKVFHDLHR